MDIAPDDLPLSALMASRPSVMDLSNTSESVPLQLSSTYNIFHVKRGPESAYTNMVPPVLHIRLGLINKVVAGFDSIVLILESRKECIRSKGKDPSSVSEYLAVSLHSIGVRSEKYCFGMLAGKP